MSEFDRLREAAKAVENAKPYSTEYVAAWDVLAGEADATTVLLPETCGWVAYDGVKDRGVIYVADLRAALAGDDEADSPSRTHQTAPVSDPGLESGQGDHRDDEGRSGAQEEGK